MDFFIKGLSCNGRGRNPCFKPLINPQALFTFPTRFNWFFFSFRGRRRRSVEKLLRALARDATSEEETEEKEERRRDNEYEENLLNLLYEQLGTVGLPDWKL